MVRIGFWVLIDRMTSIGTTHSNKEVVFTRQKSGYLTLAFTSVLAANNYINISSAGEAKESKTACNANKNIVFSTSVRVNNNIRYGPVIHPR